MKFPCDTKPTEMYAIKYTYKPEFGLPPRYQYFDSVWLADGVFLHTRNNPDLEKCELLTGFIEWAGES